MDYREVCSAIVSGQISPEHFPQIQQSMNHVKELKSMDISIGDKVRFNSSVNPKYLHGAEAKVCKVNRTTFALKMLSSRGKFLENSTLTAPKNIVEKV